MVPSSYFFNFKQNKMILLLHLLGLYIVGCMLSYGFINLHNQITNIKPIDLINSFKSWYFIYQIYYTNTYYE